MIAIHNIFYRRVLSPTCRVNHFPAAGRSGVSLLEVVLALALSVMVFTAISVAIQTHLASLAQQQIKIERKQIARAALGMIANDCRAGVQYKASDFSGLDNLLKSQQMMISDAMGALGGQTGGQETNGGESDEEKDSSGNIPTGASGDGATPAGSRPPAGGSTGSSSGSNSSSPTSDGETEAMYDENLVSFRPILLGTSSELMMDISRIPRLDQYSPLIASVASLAQSPSDIKSIAYYFSESEGGIKSDIEFDTAAKGGLYRREIDRAVASFAGEERAITAPDSYSKLVSPEVAEIEFRYFDGSDWKTSWNSQDAGGFPLAIEITIVIDPARTSRNNLTYSYSGFDKDSMEMYRTVVHLPMSEPKK
jgi:hypothetical protein